MSRPALHHRRPAARALLAGLLACSGAVVRAAPPEATRIVPAGARRGTTVTARVSGSFPVWPAAAWTERAGTAWEPQAEPGTYAVTVAPDAALGPHLVRFASPGGATAVRRFVVGHLPQVEEAEPNDRVAQAMPLEALPVVVEGVLAKAGDADLYRVRLSAGQRLVAQADAHRLLRSPADLVLEVVDPGRSLLARNLDAAGLDPRVEYVAAADGDVVVRVWGFPENPDSTIGLAGGEGFVYRLSLGVDRFLTAGLPLAATRGRDGGALPTGPGLEAASVLPIPAAATLPAATGARGTVGLALDGVAGSAEIAVVEMPVVTAVDVDPPPAPPAAYCGILREPRRPARHRFAAAKGAGLALVVEGLTIGTAADPLLAIRDATGALLASTDEPAGTLSWTAPADGVFVAEVADRRGGSGPSHAYRLSIEPAAPRARVTCEIDRVSGAPGKPIEVAVAIRRDHGFAEPLEVILADAPAGVTAAPATSAPSGDTATKVVLAVVAAAPVSAPVRIVARIPGSADAAPLPVRCGPEGLDTLWLGVEGAAP